MTLKEAAHITGLHKCVVKDIDKARLEGLYVTIDKDGKKNLIKPEHQARFIGIDEFKITNTRSCFNKRSAIVNLADR